MPKIAKEIQDLFGYTDKQVEGLKENQIQLFFPIVYRAGWTRRNPYGREFDVLTLVLSIVAGVTLLWRYKLNQFNLDTWQRAQHQQKYLNR